MSIVIAVARPAQAADCLRFLAADPALEKTERIAVCAARDEIAPLSSADPACVTLTAADGRPAQRAAGITKARGELVAVLNEDYRPREGWARAATERMGDADVLVGEVHPARATRRARMAAFCWEYLHWLPRDRRTELDGAEARLAPAGAVIYRRDAVDASAMASARSELDYHARMFASGLRFIHEPELRVEYEPPEWGEFLRLRAGWSTDWARRRVEDASLMRRALGGAARLLWPPLAVWRYLRRAARAREWRGAALRGLPYALSFACAEGWGEMRGYWSRRG